MVNLLIKKIDIQIKIYKTDEHPHVATTLSQIAQQWSKKGEYKRALKQFEKIYGSKYISVNHSN